MLYLKIITLVFSFFSYRDWTERLYKDLWRCTRSITSMLSTIYC